MLCAGGFIVIAQEDGAEKIKGEQQTTKRGMKRYTMYLLVSDMESMADIAQREGLQVADLVRRACREFVKRESKTKAK
jgi:hypothetical protein